MNAPNLFSILKICGSIHLLMNASNLFQVFKINFSYFTFQYDALKTHFERACAKDKKDYHAKELAKLYSFGQYKAFLLFLFPILSDLRRITKVFQLKSGNNLELYEELKECIVNLATRFLKPAVIQRNNIYQLMYLDLTTDFCLLPLNSVNYGTPFENEMKKFTPQDRLDMQNRARDYLKTLFLELRGRLCGTIKTLQ